MSKAVLTTKPRSIYDDLPERRYHFPRTYLRQVEAAVGDFIVYYEPAREGVDDRARTGRRAYFATARAVKIDQDPNRRDHYYAIVDNYLEFEGAVPFRIGTRYLEHALRRPDGKTNRGAFGRAVRLIDDDEYETICRLGFSTALKELVGSAIVPAAEGVSEMVLAEEATYTLNGRWLKHSWRGRFAMRRSVGLSWMHMKAHARFLA
jgi:putative restriction endonuclease